MKLRNIRNHPFGRWASITLLRFLVHLFVLPPRLIAKLNFALANLYQDSGNIRRAERAFAQAVEIAAHISQWDEGFKLTYVDFLRKQGFFKLNALKDFSGAFKDIDEAVDVLEKELQSLSPKSAIMEKSAWNDHRKAAWRVAANTYAALGNYYYDTGNLSEAEKYFWISMNWATQANYYERLTTLWGDLGNVALRQHNWPEAERRLENANEMARKAYKYAVPSSYIRLSQLYADSESGQRFSLQKALDKAQFGLKAAREAKWPRHTADALMQLADVERKMGYILDVDPYIHEANKIYKRLGMK